MAGEQITDDEYEVKGEYSGALYTVQDGYSEFQSDRLTPRLNIDAPTTFHDYTGLTKTSRNVGQFDEGEGLDKVFVVEENPSPTHEILDANEGRISIETDGADLYIGGTVDESGNFTGRYSVSFDDGHENQIGVDVENGCVVGADNLYDEHGNMVFGDNQNFIENYQEAEAKIEELLANPSIAEAFEAAVEQFNAGSDVPLSENTRINEALRNRGSICGM